MKIACLGWGSLIWRPENLLIQREWFIDGPFLPIEFTRQSNDGRLTLVINEKANPVRSLWALMATNDLKEARDSLRKREGVGKDNFENYISNISIDDKEVKDPIKLVIQNWARSIEIDIVIWTSLPSRFNGKDNEAPTLKQAVKYLMSLDINTRNHAEQYIRKAPRQIDTQFRREFEKLWGWTYLEG